MLSDQTRYSRLANITKIINTKLELRGIAACNNGDIRGLLGVTLLEFIYLKKMEHLEGLQENQRP